jgi:hypothetical protein
MLCKERKLEKIVKVVSVLIAVLLPLLGGMKLCHAELVFGKIYDKTNYQEIEEMLLPSVATWVKNGEFILKHVKLNYDFKPSTSFIKASEQNYGKYQMNAEGYVVDKSGKRPGHIFGMPFSDSEIKGESGGKMLMENFQFMTAGSTTATSLTALVQWVGNGGIERELLAYGSTLIF